jgi:N-acetylglucosamine-6-phosphate deacetylase
MDSYLVVNSRIITPTAVLDGQVLAVKDGIIEAITPLPLAETGLPVIDAGNAYLSPALIELHIHGCGPYGFESGEQDVLEKASVFLADRGILTFVPTVQCDEGAIGRLAFELVAKPGLRDHVPGIYVEGPFINPEFRGGILEKHIRKPDRGYLDRLVRISQGMIRLMTVAPEIGGCLDLVPVLREYGIIPCLGHSGASPSALPPSLAAGTWNITHLYNAMSGISHRKAGLAKLPFLNRNVFAELNGDGVHCVPEILEMSARNLDPERLILISDAVVSAGLPFGDCTYYGQKAVSGADGVRYAGSGTLIGSNSLIYDVLWNMQTTTNTPLEDLVRFAALNPARLLGLDSRLGSIEPGKRANLVLLDGMLAVKRVLSGD